MANYNLVIDASNFKPYDISIPLNIIDRYNTQYEKNLAVYDKIALELGTLKSAVAGSTITKDIYDRYMNDFLSAADSFSRGMNIFNAKLLAQLRSRYGMEINALEEARQRMLAEVLARKTRASLQGGDMMLYEDLGNLDNYYNDPTFLPKSYSGDTLMKQAAVMSKAFASQLMQMDTSLLDLFTKVWQTKVPGLTPADVENARRILASSPDKFDIGDNVASKIFASVILSSGLNTWDKWKDLSFRDLVTGYISQGINDGIPAKQMNTYDDYGARENLRLLNDLKKAAVEHQYKLAENLKEWENKLYYETLKSLIEAAEKLGQGLPTKDVTFFKPGNTLKDVMKTIEAVFNAATYDKNGKITNVGGLKSGFASTKDKTHSGFINPLFIYDEYIKYARENATITGLGPSAQNGYVNSLKINPDYTGAKKYIKDTYGVTSILTYDQYNKLKTLGLSTDKYSKGINYVNTVGLLNKQSTKYTFSSVNMSGLDIEDRDIRSNIVRHKDLLGNAIFKVNTDGSKGKGVDYDDLNIKDDDNDKGLQITDMLYSVSQPNYIMIEIGTGNHYFIDPALAGAGYEHIIELGKAALAEGKESPMLIQLDVTIAMAKLNNAYNALKTTTSSNVDE